MRIVLVLLGLVSLSAGTAWAAATGAGCGPGGAAMKGKSGTFFITVAMTTDALLFPTNVTAVTSETSGCKRDSVILREKEQEYFLNSNLDALAIEMARGQGTLLVALAELMGCPAGMQAEFARFSQRSYETLFGAATPRGRELLASLKEEIRSSPALGRTCSRVT